MAYRITMTQLDVDTPGQGRSASFEVPTDIEALRIAQEGVAIARERGRSVVYEVHGPEGQLVMLYSSTAPTD